MTIKIKLMWFEKEFCLAPQKYLNLFGGRGSGKSHGIQARIKWRSTKYPKLRTMYVAASKTQCTQVFREISSDFHFKKFIKKTANRDMEIFLRNGSYIWFRTFQRPELVRSTGEDDLYIDESQDPVFQEDKVETVLMPLLGRRQSPAGGRGVLVLAGQFRGDDWRKKRYWDRGTATLEDGSKNPFYKPNLYKSWRIPSSEGYAYKTPGGAEQLELVKANTRKAVWDQEWDCIPTANANAAFPAHEVDAIINKSLKLYTLYDPLRHRGYCTGVDIGRIIDGTVIVTMSNTGQVVYFEVLPQGMEYAIAAKKAAQVAAHFNSCMIVDFTGGARPGTLDPDKYVKLYREAAKMYQVTFREFYWGRNKNTIIESLALAIHQRRCIIPIGCDQLISEVKAYEYQWSDRTHCYSYGAPKGRHDDCVAALAQAWYGVESGMCPTGGGNVGALLQ